MADTTSSSSVPPSSDFLGNGWAFPFGVTGGRFAVAADDALIRQSILQILQTAKGERVMEPEFGCDLARMVFQANNDTAINLAAYAVRAALDAWEPRIRVIDVTASPDRGLRERLLIAIEYEILSFNRRQNLVYPFYLG